MKRLVSLLALLTVPVLACGGGTAAEDAATPLGTDAFSPMGGTDAFSPMGADDAFVPMGGTDAFVPMGGTDAAMSGTRDPRLETDPAAGRVGCGMTSCMLPDQVCCTSLSGQMCTGPAMCSGGLSARGACDGPEDCAGGELCCAPSGFADLTMGTTCAASCGSRFQMCQTSADCSGGATCHTCRPPGGMGGVVGLCNSGPSCPGSYMTL